MFISFITGLILDLYDIIKGNAITECSQTPLQKFIGIYCINIHYLHGTTFAISGFFIGLIMYEAHQYYIKKQ